MNLPKVTFIVVFRDAAEHLPGAFAGLLAQDYPKDRLQVILVDGMSGDASKRLCLDFKAAHPELDVAVRDNPGRLLACGWNVALAEATGEIILRVDAHAGIPADFVRRNAEAIAAGRDVVGGPRLTILPEEYGKRLIALAECSRFGSGAARYRHEGAAGYVDTLAHAAYRREAFVRVGGYHELLGRTEDNEMHDRMKRAGFRFWFDPSITSTHKARAGLAAMLKQKWGNGYWIGLTMAVAPGAFGVRHFVPGAFVAALAAGLAAGALGSWLPLAALLAAYFAAAAAFAGAAVRGESLAVKAAVPALMLLFLLMHLAYGAGTLRGLAELPFFAPRAARWTIPRPLRALLAAVLLAGAAAARTHDVRDYGAKGNGRADDTRAIAKAVDAAADDGGGRVLLPAGRYKANVVMRAGVELAGEGPEATFLLALPSDGKKASYAIYGEGATGASVRDLTVVADGAKVFWPAGVRFAGSSGVRVERVVVTGSTNGQGIVFDEAPGFGSDNVVSGCTVRDCDQGIVADNENVRIAGNYVENCKLGISLEYETPHAAVVSGNIVDAKGRAESVGIVGMKADRAAISGNNVRGAWIGIYIKENSSLVSVTGNVVTGTFGIGIKLEDASDVLVRDNLVEPAKGKAVVVERSPGSEVSGNLIKELK